MLGTNKLHGLRWSFLILLLLLFTLFAPLIASASPFVIGESTPILTWTTKEVMPMTIGRAASGVVQDKIYVLGGSITGAGGISGVEMYDPASNSWQIKTSLIEPRYATGNATIGSTIYLVGGAGTAQSYRSILAYNTSNGSSSQVGTLITGRGGTSCAVVDNKIYVVGGDYGNVVFSSMEEFDPSTNTSTPEATLPAPRTRAAVASVGGKIYIMGGLDSSYAPTNTCWEYDPATNSFTEKSPMLVTIGGNTATTYNGKIYLSGGITSQGLPPTSWASDVQEYNPATDTWRNVGSVPTPRYAPVAEVVNNTLYVMGGHNGSLEVNVNEAADLLSLGDNTPPTVWATPAGGNYTSAVSVALSANEPASIYYTTDGTTPTPTSPQYIGMPIDIITTTTLNFLAIDAAGNVSQYSETYTINDVGGCPTFLTKASMPTARLGANSGVVNNMVWVLGGSNRLDPPPRGALSTVEMYNPYTDSWTTKPSLPAPRFSAGDATLGNIIYLAGGDDGTSTLNTVLAYNTVDGSCTQIGTINTARFRTDADIINGKIYIAGGTAFGGAVLNSIEEYDLSKNESTVTATLPAARDFAAVVAYNDKLYIIGGFDSSGNPTNSCWEYNPATYEVTQKSPMPIARGGKQVFVMNGKIYVGGGITTPGPPPMTYIGGTQEYDPVTDTWMTMPCAPPTPRWGAVTEVANNSVYAIGGCDNVQALSVNEATDPMLPPDTIPPTAYVSPAGGIYSSSQAVTLSASEPAAIYYTLDGTDPTPASMQYVGVPINIIATTTLKFMAIDTAGNPSQVYAESYMIDTVAPTPVISISGTEGPSPWYTSDVQVTLSASDVGSGVASIEYSLDNTNWSVYTGPFMIATEGTSGVYYRATDSAGNTQHLGPAIIQIDKTKPTHVGSQSGTLGQNGWYISDVQVTLTASDSVSGVQRIEKSPDGINWITYAGPFMLTTEGTTTGHSRSIDNAGNVGDVKQKVTKIDKSGPATSIHLSGEQQNGWYTSDVQVTLSAFDAVSGVAETEYSFDNVNWQVYTGPFIVSEDRTTKIYFHSTDNAGNTEPTIAPNIAIDRINPAPAISLSGTLGQNGWYASDVQVTLSASDVGSGVASIEYSLDHVNWNVYTGPFIITTEGTSTVCYRATDNAGNMLCSGPEVIRIDKTKPTHYGIRNGTLGQNGWYISDVQADLVASDSISGVQKIERSRDGVNWVAYTGPLTLTTEGTLTGYSRATDNAGNVGDIKQQVTKIDKSDPTTAINISGTLGQNGWYKSDVLVTLTAADAISGVAVTEYSLDGQNWLTYTVPFLITTEGITTICFRSIDNAGRLESIKSQEVKIDKTMPEASISATGTLGENNRYISDVTVALSAADAVSGLSGIEYSFDNTTWNAYASSFVVSNEGTTTVYYRSVDVAGNAEVAKQLVIVIDRIAPTVSSTDPVNGSLGVPVNETIVITFDENIQVGANFGAITFKKNKTDIAYTASVSGNTLIVKPNADLTYNTTFDISIPAGAVKDMTGHALASPYAFSFETAKR